MKNYKVIIKKKTQVEEFSLDQQPDMDAAIAQAIKVANANGFGLAYEVKQDEALEKEVKPGWYVCNSFGPDTYCESPLEAAQVLYKEAFPEVVSVEIVEGEKS